MSTGEPPVVGYGEGALDEAAQQVLECCVCLEPAVEDPVCMTCKAQHVLHFQCLFDFYDKRSDPSSPVSCPLCRHGNGSFIVLKRLKQLLGVLKPAWAAYPKEGDNDSPEETPPSSQLYYHSLRYLGIRFPRTYRLATDSCVIDVIQMSIFVNNFDVLLRVLEDAGTIPRPHSSDDDDEDEEEKPLVPAPPVEPRDAVEAILWRNEFGQIMPRRSLLRGGGFIPWRGASPRERSDAERALMRAREADQAMVRASSRILSIFMRATPGPN